MKILITGSSGMLGRALCEELSNKYEIIGLDIVELKAPACPAGRQSFRLRQGFGGQAKLKTFVKCDILEQEKTITQLASLKPDIVVHTAAYTDVDGCEQHPEKAHQVNAQGTETIAMACQKCAAFLYYISTDFVFDGEKKTAYLEEDLPHPINVYGRSKLEAEEFVQSILKEFIIVRSSWLFGKGGRNFVDTILEKAQNETRIEVVNDQFGSPTYTKDLAQAIKKLIDLTYVLCPTSYVLKGIYHITNSGSCSWYEFARTIKETADLDLDIVPVSSEQYDSPTKRPKMSRLENRRYQEAAGEKLRHWKEALEAYLR